MPNKVWTSEERKAFGEKMKAAKEAKDSVASPPIPPTANSQQDSEISAKLAELDAEIRKVHELTNKLEKQEQERTEAFASGIKGMSVQEQQHVVKAHESKKEKMKKHLAEQEKVRVFVPLEGKEKMGTQLPVTLNGYRVNVPKGRYVEVPQQVGEIIMDSLNQTQEAIDNDLLIDKDEKKQVALQ